MSFWSTLLVAVSLGQAPTMPAELEPAAPEPDLLDSQARVSAYVGEAAPPAPIPTAPPAAIGLSLPIETASASGYVNNLYEQSYGGCCDGGNDGPCGRDDCEYCNGGKKKKWKSKCSCCKACTIHSTCDMYPHYPYYPMHHGYYYFRPYNYTNVQIHQGQIVAMGGDARSPYSGQLLANINVPSAVPPATSTRTPRQGPILPILEDLLPSKSY